MDPLSKEQKTFKKVVEDRKATSVAASLVVAVFALITAIFGVGVTHIPYYASIATFWADAGIVLAGFVVAAALSVLAYKATRRKTVVSTVALHLLAVSTLVAALVAGFRYDSPEWHAAAAAREQVYADLEVDKTIEHPRDYSGIVVPCVVGAHVGVCKNAVRQSVYFDKGGMSGTLGVPRKGIVSFPIRKVTIGDGAATRWAIGCTYNGTWHNWDERQASGIPLGVHVLNHHACPVIFEPASPAVTEVAKDMEAQGIGYMYKTGERPSFYEGGVAVTAPDQATAWVTGFGLHAPAMFPLRKVNGHWWLGCVFTPMEGKPFWLPWTAPFPGTTQLVGDFVAQHGACLGG